MTTKLIYRAALIGATVGMAAWSGFAAEKKPQGAPQMPPAVVETGKVAEVSESEAKDYVGHLEAIEEVDLRARVSGNITSIRFSEGDQVRQGDLLIELEDTTYRAKQQAARAKRDQVRAELEYAQSNRDRQKNLIEKSATSQSTWEDAERLYKLTAAQLAEAEATLMDAENDLSYTKIHAPISGRIGKLTYTHGNYVTPSSSALADIVQTDPVYAAFAISERDYLALFGSAEEMKKSANIRLKLADDTLFETPGEVAFVDNKIDPETNTVTIWATFKNPRQKLIPGGYVRVVLSKRVDKKYPAVMLSAVLHDSTGSFVYVLDDKNTVIRRPVTLGPMINNMQVITSGVAPGETVIIDGTHKTAPGATVSPVQSRN